MISKNLFPFIFALLFTVIAYSCSQNETIITPPQPMNCNITIPAFAVQLPCTVVYRAEKVGTVTASKLTYRNNSGLQTVNNPSLPYIDTLILNMHDTVSMSVESVVTGGTIDVKVRAKTPTGMINQEQSCGN